MLKVKTLDENNILMRNLSSLIAGFSLIIAIIPIFLEPIVNYHFVPIFKIAMLIIAVTIALILIIKKERLDQKYLIPLTITLFLFMVAEILAFIHILEAKLAYITIANTSLLDIFIHMISIIAIIPLYILLISQIRKAEKHIPRRVKLSSLFVTIFLIILVSPLITAFSTAMIAAKDYFSLVFGIVFIIIDLDILAIALTFIYLNWKVRSPLFWITIGVAWIFKLAGDSSKGYFLAIGTYDIGTVSDLFINVCYASFVVGIVTMIEQYEKPLTISQMEKERKQYQTLYEEMNIFAKDLVTVTSLLRHDLLNDLVVIQSGVELFEETKKQEYLERAKSRVDTVAKRLDLLKSESKLLESLKIQPIEINIINNVAESFDNVTIHPYRSNIKVNANRLLYPILFNFIQNAFQHAGKGIDVEVKIEEQNNEIVISVSDNGKGISEENKRLIFQQGYKGTDKGVSGMGLFLAQIVIESFGGSIRVLDNKPQGTIFEIKLKKAKKK